MRETEWSWSGDFEWDSANIRHIARHNVSPEEAEDTLLGDPHELGYEVVDGEERLSYVGATTQGRFLLVVITERAEWIRVVTAYDAPSRAIVEYLRNR